MEDSEGNKPTDRNKRKLQDDISKCGKNIVCDHVG